MSSRAEIRTLIVDDDADIRLLASMIIERADDGLVLAGVAADGAAALDCLEECAPTVVVVDYMMPSFTGLETARRMRELFPDMPIVLFSAYLSPELEAEALAQGIKACLDKSEVRRLPDVVRRVAAA